MKKKTQKKHHRQQKNKEWKCSSVVSACLGMIGSLFIISLAHAAGGIGLEFFVFFGGAEGVLQRRLNYHKSKLSYNRTRDACEGSSWKAGE